MQHENTRLRLNQRSPEDDKLKVSVVQSLLDDTNQQLEQLRLENRYETDNGNYNLCVILELHFTHFTFIKMLKF